MPPPRPARELRSLLALATPLAAVQLGNQLLGIVDLAVVGRLGEHQLAGVGLGAQICFIASVVGFGVMLGLDPLISQAVGASEPGRARHILWQGVWLSLFVSVPTALFTWAAAVGLPLLGISPEVTASASDYLVARIPGIFFFLGLAGHRAYLQGWDHARPLVTGMVIANVINLPASWFLVFGDEGLARLGLPEIGLPSLGASGAGWASSISSVVQYGIAALALRRFGRMPGKIDWRPSRELLKKVTHIGLPIGMTIMAEAGAFTVVSLCMGWFGARPLAAHNVALSLGTTTFQVALAIGAATSVRVGHAIGRGDQPAMRRAGFLGMGAGAAFMLIAGSVFCIIPAHLARLITNNELVIESAVPFIMVCGAFQTVDGLQTVAAGALRGLGDTRTAFVVNVCGHYLLGLPVAGALIWGLGVGPVGLWWGLFVGLVTVSVVLTRRFHTISRRPIQPLDPNAN